jgi:Icc-related predicted phosphoesterase
MHGTLPKIEPCDLLLIAGDVCPTHDHHWQYQAAWMDNYLRRWLDTVDAKEVVAVLGNHDFIGEKHPNLISKDLRWTLLDLDDTVKFGLKIWGSPYQNFFCNWAFNAPEGDVEEKFLADIYRNIPDDADIIISHGPPRLGTLDVTVSGVETGSHTLLKRVEEVQPKLLVTGHIHEGYGVFDLQWARKENRDTVGHGYMVNASILDWRYKFTQKPISFDIDDKGVVTRATE